MDERIKEVLDSCDIMALATVGEDGSWVSPVHYKYNEKGELSFFSHAHAKHVENIHVDPRVSLAIYAYPRDDGNLGLQIKGRATDLDEEETEKDIHEFVVVPEEIWVSDSRDAIKPREQLL